jgi:hypothetical protein
MSKYTDTVDDCDRICPYCEHKYQPEAEDYSEDTREEDCDECGMKFHAHDSFTVSHHAEPDCVLNDMEHVWGNNESYKGYIYHHCQTCEKCERVKHGGV